MPKIRGIKPEFWTDEDITDLSIPARLLFIGLWNYACDNGHLQDKSKQIKLRLLPGDDVNVAELLRELEEKGRILRADGWITVPNFTSHQKPDKRYFQTCSKPGCTRETGNAQPDTRGGHGETTTSARGGHGVGSWGPHVDGDGDGEVMVKVTRASALPDNWSPNDQHRTFAAENLVDLDLEAAQFADHHKAKGSKMKDWDAAFRTWLRNSAKWRKPEPANGAARALPPHASELTHPPDGLTPDELSRWYFEDAQRKKAAR